MKTKFYSLVPVRGKRNVVALLAIASLLAVVPAGWSASPSELLEQGIYAEETRGDLDAALKLYQQAVAEGKGSRAAAAQAQFRLGVCYDKKKDAAAATAAFEQLVKDYPEQKELVAQATAHLFRGLRLLPAPWADGEELRFDAKCVGGPKLCSSTVTLDAGETGGQKLWRLGVQWANLLQSEWTARLEVDAATFKPLHGNFKSRGDVSIDTTYRPGAAEIRVQSGTGVKKVELPAAAYDSYEIATLIRRLPLATNYSASLTTANLKPNSTDAQLVAVPLQLRVAGLERITVPAGTYDCFKLELSTNGILQTTAWYSTDARRYPVKLLGVPNAKGLVWMAELAAVNQRRPGEPAHYHDLALGFYLKGAPGWRFDRYSGDEALAAERLMSKDGYLDQVTDQLLQALWNHPKADAVLSILDPEVAFAAEVVVGAREGLRADARPSPRAWAEAELKLFRQALPLDVHGWQELTLAGQPAVSAILDVSAQTCYCAWTFDDTNAVKFYFLTSTKDFESLRPSFEALVHSYAHSPQHAELWQEKYNLSVLDRVPAQVQILPSHSAQSVNGWGSHDRMLGLGEPFLDVIRCAYRDVVADGHCTYARILCATPLPEGRYDFISSFLHGADAALQQEIKSKFGLVGKRELLHTNVLMLKVQIPDAAGLKPNRFEPNDTSSTSNPSSGAFSCFNQPLSTLVEHLENYLKTPVVDRTGLKGRFNIDLKAQATPEEFKQALLKQLGLELVPASNQPVEFLVVDKVGNSP